jgi:hypothetical protein
MTAALVGAVPASPPVVDLGVLASIELAATPTRLPGVLPERGQ